MNNVIYIFTTYKQCCCFTEPANDAIVVVNILAILKIMLIIIIALQFRRAPSPLLCTRVLINLATAPLTIIQRQSARNATAL